jgi:2-keto-4-pentenoate hydratase
MMTEQHHIDAADAILTTRRAMVRLGPLPVSCRPATLADGYTVQEALHQRLESQGALRRGWKIGCTNKVLQDLLGIPHPCAGGIMAHNTANSGAVLPWSAYMRPGIECEVAFEIGEDLPQSKTRWTRDAVLERVAAVMPAIEVVDDRYTDHTAVGTPSLIADDFFQAGAIMGKRPA